MKKLYTLVFCSAMFFSWNNLFSQYGCGNGRYMDKIFSNYTLTSNITYGQNIAVNGSNTTLKLDVYEPQNDTIQLRPLMIWIHGGTFISGNKTSVDVKPLSEDFAKMGFVTASIDYRLGMENFPIPGPDSADATEAVIRAVHDARAAVRFFKKDFSENGNTYKIDTNLIFVCGVSAGAITAIHLAYLDEESELPTDYVDTSKAGLGGGIEGNSGNPGYVSTVKAIVNSAGAIRDSSWMKAGDTPIISFHGTNDGTVPYGTDMIYVNGFYPIMVVDGSGSLHIRADNVGMINCLKTFPGQDHTPHVGNADYTDTLEKYTSNFLLQFICGEPDVCAYPVGIEEKNQTESEVLIYPNPNLGKFQVSSPNSQVKRIEIYNVLGEKVYEMENGKCLINPLPLSIDISNQPAGIYFYKLLSSEKEIARGKFVVE